MAASICLLYSMWKTGLLFPQRRSYPGPVLGVCLAQIGEHPFPDFLWAVLQFGGKVADEMLLLHRGKLFKQRPCLLKVVGFGDGLPGDLPLGIGARAGTGWNQVPASPGPGSWDSSLPARCGTQRPWPRPADSWPAGFGAG